MATTRSLPVSLFPSLSNQSIQITDEMFNLFHKIDRQLFLQLIVNLGRDPSESMQVMAFLLYLEREHVGPSLNLVKKILDSLPPVLINQIADEVVTCLKCVADESFPFVEGSPVTDISLLQSLMTDGRHRIIINLKRFHENRVSVILGTNKIMNEICTRAFADILQQYPALMNANNMGLAPAHEGFRFVSPSAHTFYPNPNLGVPSHEIGLGSGSGSTSIAAQLGLHAQEGTSLRSSGYERVGMLMPYALIGTGLDDAVVNHENLIMSPFEHQLDYESELRISREMLEDMLSRINLSGIPVHQEEANEVPPDDRTIFLTFSKGYPISEDEVREFFTRRFGNFIENIYMQEVGDDEQVLYARIVAKTLPMLEAVVQRGRKAKYTINGKHVWARKYVKRNPKSPSGEAGTSSQPSSSS